MKLHDELEVYVELSGSPTKAGVVRALFSGGRLLASSQFEYRPEYLGASGAYPLDPQLPLRGGPFYSGEDYSLFNSFQDLTPDDWGKQIIDADLARARRSDPNAPAHVGIFDYLSLASDDARLGNMRFRAIGGDAWLGEAVVAQIETARLADVAAAAARFEMHEATDQDLVLLGAPGTSAGGARPKVTVYVDGRLGLVKLPSSRDGRFDGEAWEFVAMSIARTAGIRVQTGQLVPVGEGKSSLILDRFDRTSTGSRRGYMSARTAMELSEQTHNRVTYEDLADAVDRYSGGDADQLRDLFKRVALTVLINNVDDHWKNHGFVRTDDSWALSPAFDVNPSRSRGVVFSRPISSKDDPRNRDIRSLTGTAATYMLTNDQAAQALAEVLSAVKKWPDIARTAGISDEEIAEMAPAFGAADQAIAEREISRLIA